MVLAAFHIIVLFKLIIGCLCLFLRYGDKVPVGVCARVFAVVWIITGLVMASILVGVIATSLTFQTLDHEIILYGIKVHKLLLSNEITLSHLTLCNPPSKLKIVRNCSSGAKLRLTYMYIKRQGVLHHLMDFKPKGLPG